MARIGVSKRSGFAVFNVLKALGFEPELVIHVGVGCHYEEIPLMIEHWPDVEVIGFEAHPDTAKSQQEHYPGTLHHMAITDHDGEIDFHLKRNHADGSSIYPIVTDNQSKTRVVPCAKLDTVLETVDMSQMKHAPPYKKSPYGNVLLWLDIEGGELKALKGAANFLVWVDAINIEMTSNPPSPEWCDMITTHRWLVMNGYKRQTAHSNRTWAGQVDAIYVRPELWKAEFCTCPCSFEPVYHSPGTLGFD